MGDGASKRDQRCPMKRFLFAFSVTALALALFRPASATTSFDRLPGEQGKTSPLLLRIVEYQGSTNGAITVEVKNPTGKPQEFSAKGIYFVPTGNANQAPQRLGGAAALPPPPTQKTAPRA